MSKSVITAPSILSADFSDISEALTRIKQAGAQWIHMDVMDGSFVPNISFGPKMIRDVGARTDLPLDVHLMVDKPERYIEEFVRAGAEYVTIHLEATVHVHRVLQQIRECGCKPGIAIVPSTPVSSLAEIADEIEILLIMTVNPGFGGQKLIPQCLRKVTTAAELRRERNASFLISVDGGVNTETAPALRRAGADVLVSGSAFFESPDAARYLRDLMGEKVSEGVC